MRMVTHLGVSREDCEKAADVVVEMCAVPLRSFAGS
jgi:hypothetical protein